MTGVWDPLKSFRMGTSQEGPSLDQRIEAFASIHLQTSICVINKAGCWEGGRTRESKEAPHHGPCPTLSLCISYICLFLRYSLYNQQETEVKCFPEFCESQWIIKPEEGVVEVPRFTGVWSEVLGLVAGIWSMGSLWGWPLAPGVCTNSKQWQNLIEFLDTQWC